MHPLHVACDAAYFKCARQFQSRRERHAYSSERFRLRFTGRADFEEFAASCRREPYWYHSYYFENGFHVQGCYDIGKTIGDYGFPLDMRGMRVLDVGPASGWFSYFFHQRGADVTAVDVRGFSDWDIQGRLEYPPIELEKKSPDRFSADGKPIYHGPTSANFWVIHDLLESKIKFANGRIYDLPSVLGSQKFDLIFLGCLLLHLRDPMRALAAVREVCQGQVVATTPVMESGLRNAEPRMASLGHIDCASWWKPNRACLRNWFTGAGFSKVKLKRLVALVPDKSVMREDSCGELNPFQWLQLVKAGV